MTRVLKPGSGSRGGTAPWLILSALCTAVFTAKFLGLFSSVNLAVYDFAIRDQRAPSPDISSVVVVGITDAYVEEHDWPLPNRELERAIGILTHSGAAAIGIDMYKSHEEITRTPSLEQMLIQNPHVIGISKFSRDDPPGLRPHEGMLEQGRIGFSDMMIDSDGVVRRRLLALDDGQGEYQFSFALRLAAEYLADRNIRMTGDREGNLKLGEAVYVPLSRRFGGYGPVDERGYQHMIDFGLVDQSRVDITFRDLVAGNFEDELLKDRIVLIGVKSEYVKDSFLVPGGRAAYRDRRIHGVDLHALLAFQYVSESLGRTEPMKDVSEAVEYVVLISLLFAGFALAWAFGTFVAATAALGIAAGVFVLGLQLHRMFIWYPAGEAIAALLVGCIGGFVSVLIRERQDKEALRNLFSRFVSEPLLGEFWRQRNELMVGNRPVPRKLFATVLFLDLAGSTSTSERLGPGEYIDWLSPVLKAMADHVVARGGVIEKFQGDGMMALFGVPVPRETPDEKQTDAVNALNAVLAINSAVRRLNEEYVDNGLPSLAVRAGVASGEVVGGCVGTDKKLQYTVSGFVTNTAARLEAMGKSVDPAGPTTVLLTETTKALVDGRFEVRDLGSVALQGRQSRERVFQLVDTGG